MGLASLIGVKLMGLGFKVLGPVGNFSVIRGNLSLLIPEILVFRLCKYQRLQRLEIRCYRSRQPKSTLEFQWPVGPLATPKASTLGYAIESCPQYFVDPLILFYFQCVAILHMACSPCSPHLGGGTGWHHNPLYGIESTSRRASRTCTPP